MKNKTTAAVLAFFLGGIGVHRFYLGQTGLGILYLIFFWTFIPAFIALIDFIAFLIMDDSAFDAKYNSAKQAIYVNNNVASSNNVADELEKLHNLKEKGIITESEFQNRKARLL